MSQDPPNKTDAQAVIAAKIAPISDDRTRRMRERVEYLARQVPRIDWEYNIEHHAEQCGVEPKELVRLIEIQLAADEKQRLEDIDEQRRKRQEESNQLRRQSRTARRR